VNRHTPTECDFLVVGAGIAGLRAAVELADAGRVLVLAKRQVRDSATHYAQGGIAAALSDEDEVSLHLQDTLVAGDGLCNVEAVRVLVEEGLPRIDELIEWGRRSRSEPSGEQFPARRIGLWRTCGASDARRPAPGFAQLESEARRVIQQSSRFRY
jgi:aspartate oxidase